MDREDIAELFAAFGPVGIRRVFSGFGVYAEDVCFALFLRGEIYLKADEATAPRFAGAGSRPFNYTQPASGKVVTVNSFWRLPERLYDDADELAEWARMAVATARRLKAAKSAPKSRAKAKSKARPNTRSEAKPLDKKQAVQNRCTTKPSRQAPKWKTRR